MASSEVGAPAQSGAHANDGADQAAVPPRAGNSLLVLPWELSSPGGVSQVVQNLIDVAEPAFGRRALLLVNTWAQRVPIISDEDGRRTVRMMVQGPLGECRPWRHFASFALRFPSAAWRLRKLLQHESITQINVHYPGLDALTWLLIRGLSRQRPVLVLSFHGTDYQQARAVGGLRRRLWTLLLNSVDDITVCSRSLRDEIQQEFGVAKVRVRDVDNGVDPARIVEMASPPPQSSLPGRFAVSLATFEHKKGLDVLLEAFEAIAGKVADVHLIVAGRLADAPYFEKLCSQREALRCCERVHFMPDLPHAEAMRILARADVLVLASRREPFGIVVLEAGVLGVPAVATDVCGVVERLRDDAAVEVVPAQDAGRLAAAVTRLLDDGEYAGGLAERLRARVLSDFTWLSVAAQYDYHPLRDPQRGSLQATQHG